VSYGLQSISQQCISADACHNERIGRSLLTSKALATIPPAIRLSNSRGTRRDWIHADNVAVLEGPWTGWSCLFRFDVDRHALLDSLAVGDGFISELSAKAWSNVEAAVVPRGFTLPAGLGGSFFPRRSPREGRFSAAPVCSLLRALLFLLRSQEPGDSEHGKTSLFQRLRKTPIAALFLSDWCVAYTAAHQSTSRTGEKWTGC